MRKLKVAIHSDSSKAFTGFGKHMKNLLTYLHRTGKYEVYELANGSPKNDSNLSTRPWKAFGTLPTQDVLQSIASDPAKQRQAQYGHLAIDKLIEEIKPDVYIGVQDIWGMSGFWDKKWWNKLTPIVHTTLDSLPILPEAVSAAPKIKNYYVWAKFAAEAMRELGHKHVEKIPSIIECNHFYNIGNDKKKELRQKFKIPENSFIFGDVFRNQLRKSVPNLIQAFWMFCEKYPESEARLLLHTCWREGWDILRIIKNTCQPKRQLLESDDSYNKRWDESFNDFKSKVLTTYINKSTREYIVSPFMGEEVGEGKLWSTVSIQNGVSESQLNEVYNLIDVGVFLRTSGGCEIPIGECKLTETPIITTDYSFGQDWLGEDSGGFKAEWQPYYEPGTQFIKSSAIPTSCFSVMEKLYNSSPEDFERFGILARNQVLSEYSVESVGKRFEAILDSCNLVDWSDFHFGFEPRNPNYEFRTDIEDDTDWLIDIYKNILKMEVDSNDSGLNNWLSQLKNIK